MVWLCDLAHAYDVLCPHARDSYFSDVNTYPQDSRIPGQGLHKVPVTAGPLTGQYFPTNDISTVPSLLSKGVTGTRRETNAGKQIEANSITMFISQH